MKNYAELRENHLIKIIAMIITHKVERIGLTMKALDLIKPHTIRAPAFLLIEKLESIVCKNQLIPCGKTI